MAQLGEGEVFGEMGLVDDKPRTATAMTLERTELSVVSAENFEHDVLRDQAEASRYFATLIERLRTTDALLQIALRHHSGLSAVKGEGDSFETQLLGGAEVDNSSATPRYSDYRVLLASAYEPGKWRGDTIAIEIESFPYRIGCQYVGPGSPFMRNDLLVRDTLPGYISRDHCAIERNADTILLRDRGSAEGTIVNGKPIGTAAGNIVAPLNIGENVVIFGGIESPHRFFVNVMPVE